MHISSREDSFGHDHDVLFFSITLIILALTVLLPRCRNSDPESHNRLFSPLPALTVRAYHFYPEKDSALSALVGSRRIVLTHAIIGALDSRQLAPFF